MSEAKVCSVTVQFDTRIPAVYLYLRDPTGFRSHKSKQVAAGVVLDFDEKGEVTGIELLGLQNLEAVLRQVIPEDCAEILKQLDSRRRILEEILSSAAA
jgi:uncharacterized protein YuzE